MESSSCVDWLSLTGSLDLETQLKTTKFAFSRTVPVQAIARYPQGFELKPCGTLFISDTEKQGSLLTLTGQELQTLRERCHDDGLILDELLPFTRCTRIDYAVDIYAKINLERLEHYIKKDDYHTRFKSEPFTIAGVSQKTGYTLYFGSPKSKRRVRVYDKAAQMKLLSRAWARVELQNRQRNAESLAKDMLKHSWQAVGSAAIRDCLDFPKCRWWKKYLAGDDVPLTKIPRKETRWQSWLKNQVLPSIERRLEARTDTEFIEDWLASLNELVSSKDTGF